MKNNKIKKIAIICATLFSANSSYAIWGLGDFNVTDAYRVLQESMKSGLQQSLNFKIAATPAKIAENQAKITSSVEKLKASLETRRKNIPDPQACEYMKNNGAVLNASNQTISGTAQAIMANSKKEQTKGEEASKLNELKNSTSINCSKEDVTKGIHGCGIGSNTVTIGLTAGLDSNPSSQFGGYAYNADGTMVGTTGPVIPRETAFGKEYKGVKSAENFIERKYYSEEPAEILNKNANNSPQGEKYNSLRKSYINRKNVGKAIELNYIQKYAEMENADQGMVSFWNGADLKEIYGDKFYKTKFPSEQAILEYAVNKNFTKLATAINSLGDKGSETQLLALQSKIMLEQLNAQRDTNRILGSLLMQAMDPITPQKLETLRSNAEVVATK